MLSERMKSVEEKIAKATEGSSDVLFREEENRDEDVAEKSKGWRARKYTISDNEVDGRKFYQNEEGSIDLAHPREDALREAKIPIIPFRLTPSMVNHIWRRHRKELRLKDKSQAASFAVNVMENFDHIRKGDRDKTYVFSIENGRESVGMRAIGIVVDSESGDFLGTVSSGYENMQNLKEREQLWGESAKGKSPTDTASANVSTVPVQQGGELVGSAPNQSISSEGKGSENFGNSKENGENLRFSEEDEDEEPRTLVGVHNISEEKLRKGIRLGGSVNPSIAVYDTAKNYKHTGIRLQHRQKWIILVTTCVY